MACHVLIESVAAHLGEVPALVGSDGLQGGAGLCCDAHSDLRRGAFAAVTADAGPTAEASAHLGRIGDYLCPSRFRTGGQPVGVLVGGGRGDAGQGGRRSAHLGRETTTTSWATAVTSPRSGDGTAYTYLQDLVSGTYRVPWEDEVVVTDGTGVGFGTPADVRRGVGLL